MLPAVTRACLYILIAMKNNGDPEFIRGLVDTFLPWTESKVDLNRVSESVVIPEWGISEPNAHFAALKLGRYFVNLDASERTLMSTAMTMTGVGSKLERLIRNERSNLESLRDLGT
jgi:hypothetical protein